MKNKSPKVDAYIEKSADFAKPMLNKIRQLFHKGCPEVEEKIKWGVPSFEYKGMLGGMAAFKAHFTFGFWNEELMSDPHQIFKRKRDKAMMGTKYADISELPNDKVILQYIKEAVRLNDEGVKKDKAKPKARQVEPPDYFLAALKKNKKALATFEKFSPSNKREYVEWVVEAKREATREKRLKQAIEWMAEGKPRNWKYMNC